MLLRRDTCDTTPVPVAPYAVPLLSELSPLLMLHFRRAPLNDGFGDPLPNFTLGRMATLPNLSRGTVFVWPFQLLCTSTTCVLLRHALRRSLHCVSVPGTTLPFADLLLLERDFSESAWSGHRPLLSDRCAFISSPKIMPRGSWQLATSSSCGQRSDALQVMS